MDVHQQGEWLAGWLAQSDNTHTHIHTQMIVMVRFGKRQVNDGNNEGELEGEEEVVAYTSLGGIWAALIE